MKDQLNRNINLIDAPQKIVSVVPSQTELLHDIGLDEEVIGITKFCIHPHQWYKNKERVGGTKKLNIEKIKSLNPTIIFANKEENTKEDIEKLEKYFPVYISDINTFDDVIKMIEDIGCIVQKNENAKRIILQLQIKKETFLLNDLSKKSVLYLIWQNPFMTIGTDTFIHEMLHIAGFQNAVTEKRYPILREIEMKTLNPEIVFLSSEPYPFSEKHIVEFKRILPNAKIILVDGELFSWYGSRLLQSFDYFSALHEKI